MSQARLATMSGEEERRSQWRHGVCKRGGGEASGGEIEPSQSADTISAKTAPVRNSAKPNVCLASRNGATVAANKRRERGESVSRR